MHTATFILTGQVTRKDTGRGLHGLSVEAWEDDLACDDCLGSNLTNQDGSFTIQFRPEDFQEQWEGKPEVYLKVFDRDCRLIYDTRDEKRTCHPGEPVEFNISLVPDTLWWHLSRPLSLECPGEALVPENVMDEIEEALGMFAAPGWPAPAAQLTTVLCADPPIHVFDQIVRDACDTLQGDLEAARRYKDVLEALCASQAGECCCNKEHGYHKILKSIFREEWPDKPAERIKCACTHQSPEKAPCEGEPGKGADCPCEEMLVSTEKATLLITAALHVACGHAKTAKTYLAALLDQLCRFEYLGALHHAAVNALTGDRKAQDHFRDLVEFMGARCQVSGETRAHFPERKPLCCCAACLPPGLERCLRDAVRAWSQIACFTVTEVKPPRACPGEEVVIYGHGFGEAAGTILFREKGGLEYGLVVRPEDWCDDRITVTVPEGAGCGLQLRLPAETVKLCDQFLEYRPTGCIQKGFEGTSAEILKFQVKGHADGECLEPGEPLQIRWIVCAADRVRVEIIDEARHLVIASQDPADPVGIWDFTGTHFTVTTPLRVQIILEGQCQPQLVSQHVSFVYQKRPDLAIDGLEITQAVQYYRASQHMTDPADRGPDNSVRLVTGKTAWVRAYLRSGQDPTFDSGQLAGVDGTLIVERRVGGVWGVAAVLPSQNGPVTAEDSFASYETERGNINHSLNFVVPANVMTGYLRFTVSAASPYSQCPGNRARRQTTLDVNLTQTLNAAFITIGYNGPNDDNTGNLVLPAPTLADCQAETAWAMRTYPVSGAPNVRVAGTFVTNTPLNDPRSCPGCCSPNWGPLLGLVQLLILIDQAANPGGNWVYYGLINNGIPVEVPGCSMGAAGGLAGNQGGITYAHEIGHQFGLPHARCGNCGNGNPAYPVYEPYDLPVDPPGTTDWTMASTGEYGLDINNGNIANPNTFEDFMSYCGPRWISLYTYNYLINTPRLVPQVIPTGSGAASERIIRDEEVAFMRSPNKIEPLIHLLGMVDREGHVQVTNIARLETPYLVGEGKPSGYLAQLLDETGNILAQDVLYRYESEGCGCGNNSGCYDETERERSFHFKAMLKDVAPGHRLQIVKGDEVVWERESPPAPPKLSNARASLDKAGNLRLSWRLEKETEAPEEIWVRWSDDEGRTWHALSAGLTGTSVDLDTTPLPSGPIQFQVMVQDGFHTASAATQAVEIPARPPAVTIYYPRENDAVYAESRLHLWGTATSSRTGELSDEQFAWTIDEKEAGRGRDIWVENPGAGSHTVRLVVSDAGGEGSAATTITIQ